MDLREQFGNIDIYLFDQLLKGRITPPMSLLDAGCGDGRNLIYFLRHNFDVWAVDSNPQSIQQVRTLASKLAPKLPSENFLSSRCGRDAASQREIRSGNKQCSATFCK